MTKISKKGVGPLNTESQKATHKNDNLQSVSA